LILQSAICILQSPCAGLSTPLGKPKRIGGESEPILQSVICILQSAIALRWALGARSALIVHRFALLPIWLCEPQTAFRLPLSAILFRISNFELRALFGISGLGFRYFRSAVLQTK
jgi:hypothetical protein